MDVKSESGVKETIDSKSNNTFWKGIFDHYLLFAVECWRHCTDFKVLSWLYTICRVPASFFLLCAMDETGYIQLNSLVQTEQNYGQWQI